MKFFIDTADVNEIREAAELGVIDGVTTNPSLISKTGKKFLDVIKEITTIVDGPISAEAVSLKKDEIIAEARELVKIHRNIVVKVPFIPEGMKAVKVLSKEGIKTNVTLVFSPNQALIAAKVGASYVSPFIGRLDDISHVGMDLVRQIVTIYRNYGYKTEIIVASVRNPVHVLEAALAGAHVITIPFSVVQGLFKHPLTDAGVKKFLEDWEKVPK
ncbi:fructose-6-phosphate aldolase [Candidatus Desantisbacteria bacterium CG_4_10_14_0_8_um_filter_48_22]|uniref:Probable transaldolase n=1 Tax=Candidatus Desantisbacteria bacterium CG_4_10_14_0_8_um_filter_48_22 TaxID=1974543 RepID=A0A2M7SCU1_9BACT|nr:MAG: fructose-6-phosphate aldolase [Candidatus Desantisbacteria bacterium CG1_02_49_89]PIV54756.1 MAG: fructose-6-phosphate aldolase [Candidatus Desantisbacteria bacterium CG02_land_8_20_14_3_00_49_13]PIZ17290.1 MAG: fructose-6-phosphate aldolase [Candidatus Desantisbacteria bacterium CG_4_10_14_0_8_um_filter_48_22]